MIVIYVSGTPRPQPRARHLPSGKVVSTTGKLSKAWKEAVAREARIVAKRERAEIDRLRDGPFAVDHVFWFATPKAERWGQPHGAKPDRDNLDKLMMDTLRQAGALPGDDAKAADGRITKLWARSPAVMTVVREWESEPMTLREILGEDEGGNFDDMPENLPAGEL